MMESLKENGRLIVVQSTGHDPAMEIVNKAWPGEEPFATPRLVLRVEPKPNSNSNPKTLTLTQGTSSWLNS